MLGGPGDLGDDVAQTLQLLHVHGRDHGDPGGKQLLDVLPALGITAARGVSVRQIIDQDHFRVAGQHRVDIEFPAGLADDFDALQQLRGLAAAVGLDRGRNHIGTAAGAAVRFTEHRVGLADPGRGSEVDAQFPALAALLHETHQTIIAATEGVSQRRQAGPSQWV